MCGACASNIASCLLVLLLLKNVGGYVRPVNITFQGSKGEEGGGCCFCRHADPLPPPQPQTAGTKSVVRIVLWSADCRFLRCHPVAFLMILTTALLSHTWCTTHVYPATYCKRAKKHPVFFFRVCPRACLALVLLCAVKLLGLLPYIPHPLRAATNGNHCLSNIVFAVLLFFPTATKRELVRATKRHLGGGAGGHELMYDVGWQGSSAWIADQFQVHFEDLANTAAE